MCRERFFASSEIRAKLAGAACFDRLTQRLSTGQMQAKGFFPPHCLAIRNRQMREAFLTLCPLLVNLA
jgi:hypothetical protein